MKHSICMYFDFIEQKKHTVPFQGNLGLKIGRFSCMTSPIDISYKSVINEPTFTTIIALHMLFHNQ